jgi:hypothetical protein
VPARSKKYIVPSILDLSPALGARFMSRIVTSDLFITAQRLAMTIKMSHLYRGNRIALTSYVQPNLGQMLPLHVSLRYECTITLDAGYRDH